MPNMKRIFSLIIVFIIITLDSFAQTKDTIVLRESDLKNEQMIAWYTLDTIWTKNIMPVCFFENNIKLNCANCGSIYLKMQLKIDTSGKLVSYTKIKENMCGNAFTEKLEKCFLDFFNFLIFPEELRGIILEVNIGRGLKC